MAKKDDGDARRRRAATTQRQRERERVDEQTGGEPGELKSNLLKVVDVFSMADA